MFLTDDKYTQKQDLDASAETLEKISSIIFCWAFPKGEEGSSFFSG